MARWQPDAAARLAAAALALFEEHGYEHTTVVQIAERAGLTRSTFFRYYPDKREVLFQGATITDVLVTGIATAAGEAAPLEAVADALGALGSEEFTADRRDFNRRRRAVLAANPELREREVLKRLDLSSCMLEALEARGVEQLEALVATRIGMLVWELAYDRWIDGQDGETFGSLARQVLADLRGIKLLH